MKTWIANFAAYWRDRFNEKSTYAGLTLMFAAFGKGIPVGVVDALAFWGPMLAAALIAANTSNAPKG